MKESAFGITVDWMTPYWYDSVRSWAYGSYYNRDAGYLSASFHVLGLSIGIWYSK
jgi:hypothetical protein